MENPKAAVLELSNIKLNIAAGDAGIPAAQRHILGLRGFASLIPASQDWETLIKNLFPGKHAAINRYAFTSEKLDKGHLYQLSTGLSGEYRIVPLDINLTRRLKAERSEFSSDHLLNYASPEDFIRRGFGYCVLEGEHMVSAATTFVTCQAGIEIQINTRETHRRKGLATALAAELLLYCLSNGLDPNWDAANENSVGLAKKLGYTPQGSYTMYLFTGSKFLAGLTRLGLKIKEMLKKREG
jgi:GNAT superfamily N-acetyltransferase